MTTPIRNVQQADDRQRVDPGLLHLRDSRGHAAAGAGGRTAEAVGRADQAEEAEDLYARAEEARA